MTKSRLIPFALGVFLAMTAGSALAEPLVKIDLNKLEPRENACRAYFVVQNGTESSFAEFTMDLFLFGADGVVTKRIVVDSAPLDAAKTRVRPVDFREVGCDNVSMILMNDIIKCKDGTGERQDCVSLVELSNRTAAKFIK